jgi:hypothetical protein
MPRFEANTPIVQNEPQVLVEVAADAPLPVGANRFRLVVVDDSGNESAPAFLEVIVRDVESPTAVLDMVDERGRRIDPVAGFGRNFTLSGARSSDPAPGRVVEYRFTLVDRD